MRRIVFVMLAAWGVPLSGRAFAADQAEPLTLKVATIAPKGFLWVDEFEQVLKEAQARARGKVRFRFYTGGVLGDEIELARKLKAGEVAVASLTSAAIDRLFPEFSAMSLPFMVRSWPEVDLLHEKLRSRIEELANRRGLTVLLWLDNGFAALLSRYPVRSSREMKNLRAMALANSFFDARVVERLGAQPVPTELLKVLDLLKENKLDLVFCPPLHCAVFQWHTQLGYLTDTRMAYVFAMGIGRLDDFRKLDPDVQAWVRERVREKEKALNGRIEEDNRAVLLAYEKHGLEVVKPEPELERELGFRADQLTQSLAGDKIPSAWIETVRSVVEEARGAKE